jgi:hypothetical protein
MIQNGFRRIALAQGLLPEPPASRDRPTDVAPPLNAAEASNPPAGTRDDDREMLVAGAA